MHQIAHTKRKGIGISFGVFINMASPKLDYVCILLGLLHSLFVDFDINLP